ncbi:DUF4232 domain-containing protein [Streptomyces sp. NPDC048636]|uniref:DUF4232 domain-containing protein n=1 Tax=Streptomyces sp. NPDC048636 TaxID=3155762 RepID=UPI003422D1BD
MSITATNARTIRTAVASLTIMGAALTLAACGGNDAEGVKRSGSAESSAAAQASDAKGADAKGAADTQDKAARGGADAGTKGGAQAAGKGTVPDASSRSGSGARPGTCAPSDVSMSVSKVSRPVNHLLLKATNNSGRTCTLPNFPTLRFDDAQAATPAAEATKPQAVVTLAPGESGYAGILTSSADGSGSEGTEVGKLDVFLKGSDAATTVSLPGGSVYVDSSAEVTYWQSDSSDALEW